MIKLVKNDFFIYCKEARIESNRSFYGSFRLGPFDAGQSITIANALRRTLLSELKGLAITSAEIEGAFHEYSTLPGVRDSILDILLNLKDIVLKAKSVYFVTAPSLKDKKSPKSFLGNNKRGTSYAATFKKEQIGYLKTRGPGIVKASELKLPPGIQCVDPDQYIATLSEEGVLNIKFTINEGKNYVIQTYKNNQANSPHLNKDSSLPLVSLNLDTPGSQKTKQNQKKGNSLKAPALQTSASAPLPSMATKQGLRGKGTLSAGKEQKRSKKQEQEQEQDGKASSLPSMEGVDPKTLKGKNKENAIFFNYPTLTSPVFGSVAGVAKQGAQPGVKNKKTPNPAIPKKLFTNENMNPLLKKSLSQTGASGNQPLLKKGLLGGQHLPQTLKTKPLSLPYLPLPKNTPGLALYKRRRLWLKKLNLINTLSSFKLQRLLKRIAKKQFFLASMAKQKTDHKARLNKNNPPTKKQSESLGLGGYEVRPLLHNHGGFKKEKLLPLSVATPLFKRSKQKAFLPQKTITVFQKNFFFRGKDLSSRNQEREQARKFILKKKRIRSLHLSMNRGALTSLKAVSLSIDAVFMPVNKVNYIIEINEQSVMSKVTKPSSFLAPLKPTTTFNPGEKQHRNPLFLNQPLLNFVKFGLAKQGYFVNKAGLTTALAIMPSMTLFREPSLTIGAKENKADGDWQKRAKKQVLPFKYMPSNGLKSIRPYLPPTLDSAPLLRNSAPTPVSAPIKAKIKPPTIFAPKKDVQQNQGPEDQKTKTLLPLHFGKSNGFRVSNEQITTALKNNIILEIWTNGSIHPRQALYEACKNLLCVFSKLEKATPLI